MASNQQALYEVILFGQITDPDSRFSQQVLNRFTLRTDSSKALHWREIIVQRVHRRPEDEGVLVTLRKDLLESQSVETGWTLCTHLKPEPARLHPEATVRQATYCPITHGNGPAFASALGYRSKEEVYKRGYEFARGSITIHMTQTDVVHPETREILRAPETAPWHVEVKARPVRNTQETPLSEQVEAVLEFKSSMKGLIDLDRIDIIAQAQNRP